MSYTQFGLIEATDYNNLVGPPDETAANRLNTIWAASAASWGYGQSAVAQVVVGGTVTASNWATLVNTQANIGAHQGTSLTPITAPSTGQTVTALTALPTNLSTLYNNRLNAASQGSTDSLSVTRSTGWSTSLSFTNIIQFANGDAARYFFNSGGQLAVTVSHPNGSGSDALFNNLCGDCGTVVLSSPNGATIAIAGTSYTGVTKIGGGGNPATVLTNNGYYALTVGANSIFTQTTDVGPYFNSFIQINANSNGTQGSLSDRGNIITLVTSWVQSPSGSPVSAGSTTTVTIRPPSTTYIANSWGTINLGGSQTGS
jgi:hypothetical protein